MINASTLNAEIGKNLKSLRADYNGNGLTQTQLAELVGVKRTTITNIERGSQSLSVLLLYKLANALDANLEELLPNIQRVIEGSDNISSNKYSLGDGAVELSVSESKSIMDALQKYRK